MAKKDNFDLGEGEMDDLDFGDLDFNLDDDPFGNVKDDRKPFEHFVEAAKETAKSKLTDVGFLRRQISKVLPKGYVQALDAYDGLNAGLESILKDNQAELNPYMASMKKKFDTMNPHMKRLIPKSLREAADMAADNQGGSSYGEHDELGANIKGLDNLFKIQLDAQQKSDFRDAVKDTRDQKRFKAEMNVNMSAATGIGRLVSYQDNILVNYQRKHLELTYRQLDVNIRMLKASGEFYGEARNLLKAITKNTGLPDFVKMRSMEVLEQQAKQKLAQAAMGGASGFINKFFGKTTKNASDMLKGALEFNAELSQAETFGRSKAQMAGSILGNMAGDKVSELADDVLGKIAEKIKPVVGKFAPIRAGDQFLRKNLTAIPQRINEWAKSDTDYDSKFGLAEAGLKAIFDTHTASASIRGKGVDELDEAAKFDSLFHQTVTQIIPAQLASIDRWVKVAATGEDQEETAWSHYTGSLVKRSTLNQQHFKNLLHDGGSVRNTVDGILTEMEADQLTPEARRAFRVRLMTDLADANDFKPERYVKAEGWKNTPQPVVDEIIDFVADKFGIDKTDLSFNQDDKTKDFHANVRDKFVAGQKYLPNLGEKMDIYSGLIGRRSFRELGLTGFDGRNGDRIDLNNLYDMLLNSDPEKELKKKEKLNETTAEKYKRLKREQEEKEARERGTVLVDDDSGLKGNFSSRPAGGGGPMPPWPNSPWGPGTPSPANPAAGPAPSVKVDFPDSLTFSDEETHKRIDDANARIDQLIQLAEAGAQMLEVIAHFAANGGGGDEGGGGQGPGPGGPAPRRGPSLFGFLGGAARLGGRAIGGAAKGMFKWTKFVYGTAWKGAKLGARLGAAAAKFPFTRLNKFGVCDIHVLGDPEPSLTAKGIRGGRYFDVNTRKVIEKIGDITGEVKDVEGNTVLSQEDFDKGLYNGKGESLAGMTTRTAVKLGGLAAKGLGKYFSFTYGTMWKAAKWATGVLVNQFTQFDAYFPGDEEPRIRSKLMKKGYYRDAEGAPIMTLKDIKGPVYDIDGNMIISQEEIDKYKSFYKKNGSVLFTIGRGFAHVGKEAFKLAVKGAIGYGKFVGKVYKGMWKGAKAVFKGVGKGIGRLFGRKPKQGGQIGLLDGELAEAAFEVHIEQLKVQTSIYELLQKKFEPDGVRGDSDGDGVRDYSWQDILRRRKEKAAGGNPTTGDANTDAVVDAINDMNKNLSGKMDDLAEVTEEAGESSILEDAADLSELRGDRKGRRGGRGGGRGFRGKLGNAARGLGRGLGSIGRGAATAGRGLLSAGSWIARGAVTALPMLGTAAASVGSAAMTGLAAVGSGLATAAGAVASVLSAPVILGALAVGAVAYLGYRYYKSNQAKKFPLLYLRMTQYGVAPTDQKRVEKMIQLEGLCKKATSVGADGQATLDPERIDLNAFLKMFDVNGGDEQNNLLMWLQKRFKPVYLAHCLAMQTIRNTTDLSSADTGIGDSDIDTYLKTVDLPNMQEVYNDTDTSPFSSDLDTDADDVADAIKMVREKREEKKEAQKKEIAVAAATGSAAAMKAATTVSVSKTGVSPEDIAKGIKVAPPLMGAAGAYQQRAAVKAQGQLKSLDIPTAVRFKTYGLKELKLDKCEQLQKVEEIYWSSVQYSGTDKALIAGNADELKAKVFDVFKPSDDLARAEIDRWLTYRFMPAFLQYAISCRRRYNGDAKDAARNLTGPMMKEVLEEVTSSQTETMFSTKSVWTVTNSPWPGLDLETMSGSTKVYIDALDDGSGSKVLSVPGLEAEKRANPANSDPGTRLTNIALGNTTANGGGAGNVGQTGSTFANYGKIYGSGAVPGGVTGQSTTGQGTGALLMTGTIGGVVPHPGGGTGGDINSIEPPKDNGKESMKAVIIAAAKMVGFDPKVALNVAGSESGLNPLADNGMAAGLFQFIPGTWAGCMAKYGAKYGINPSASRLDPRANAILGICYLKENYEGLKKSLGTEITDLDLYMTHFLGLGGARRFLSAPRGDPAYRHVGNGAHFVSKNKGKDGGNIVLGPNASIFFDDYKSPNPTQHRTVGAVLLEMNKRMGIGLKKVGLTPSASNVVGEPPAPENPNGPSAGGGGGGNPADPSGGGSPSTAGASSEDPNAMIAAATAAVPAAAAGGASGTPSSNVSTAPTSVASASSMATPSAPPVSSSPAAPSAPEPSVESQLAPPAGFVQPPTASSAAASQSQKSSAAAASEGVAALSQVLEDTYKVAADSNSQLKLILAALKGLNTGGSSEPSSAQQTAGVQQNPARRNPTNTVRQNAQN